MSNPLFPNHKPEDADLSNIPGYKGHPGQERVGADLYSQHQNSAMQQIEQAKQGQVNQGYPEQESLNKKNNETEDQYAERLKIRIRELEKKIQNQDPKQGSELDLDPKVGGNEDFVESVAKEDIKEAKKQAKELHIERLAGESDHDFVERVKHELDKRDEEEKKASKKR